jgi:hypothetical protein
MTTRSHCEFVKTLDGMIHSLTNLPVLENPTDNCTTLDEIKNRDADLFESLDGYGRVNLLLNHEAQIFEAAGTLTTLDRLQMDRLSELFGDFSWRVYLTMSENPRPN